MHFDAVYSLYVLLSCFQVVFLKVFLIDVFSFKADHGFIEYIILNLRNKSRITSLFSKDLLCYDQNTVHLHKYWILVAKSICFIIEDNFLDI